MSGLQNENLPPGTLDAIYEAALTITSELSLPIVLNRIVALARSLVKAEYAALGIPDSTGQHLVQFITSGISPEQAKHIDQLPIGRGVLGMLLEPDAKPIRMGDVSKHPNSAGFPAKHPVMGSFMGMPIRSRGNLLGNLYLANKDQGETFTATDQKIIAMLAGYAGVAIENARLHQKVQRLAILEERDRIGMDLHDGIIQSIYAVGLTMEHMGYLIKDDEYPAAEDRLGEAIDGLNMIIKDIRNYILDLRPERFQGIELSAALTRLTREFQANTLASVGLEYSLSVNGHLTESVAVAAFHIVQEALANAAKHAAATNLEVSVETLDGELALGIHDNGRGFLMEETEERLGHGLSNMQMRALSVGGRFDVESEPGKGTHIKAYLPLSHHG